MRLYVNVDGGRPRERVANVMCVLSSQHWSAFMSAFLFGDGFLLSGGSWPSFLLGTDWFVACPELRLRTEL